MTEHFGSVKEKKKKMNQLMQLEYNVLRCIYKINVYTSRYKTNIILYEHLNCKGTRVFLGMFMYEIKNITFYFLT